MRRLPAACAASERGRVIEATFGGGFASAKSGGIGVGLQEATAVLIFRATPWIAFASSCVCKLSLPNSCTATV